MLYLGIHAFRFLFILVFIMQWRLLYPIVLASYLISIR